MYYLITYKQRNHCSLEWIYGNEVTSLSAVKWLLETRKNCKGSETILLFAIEISKEDYEKAESNL